MSTEFARYLGAAFYYGFLFCLCGGIAVGICLIVRHIVKTAKAGRLRAIAYDIFSGVLIALVVGSWICNFGWVRLLASFFIFPAHATLLFILVHVAAKYFVYSKKLKIYTHILYATYFLIYAFLPDVSDDGAPYMFFALIRDPLMIEVGKIVLGTALVLHVVMGILLLIEMSTAKRAFLRTNEQ